MTRQKKKIGTLIMCTILMITTNFQASQRVLAAEVPVQQTEADTKVIPDKYNTGCTGTLTMVSDFDEDGRATVEGVVFTAGDGHNGTRRVLDFAYRNTSVSGTVYFENYDFSGYSLWSYNEPKVDRQIKVVFNNCKFTSVTVGRTEENITFEFNNCTMNSFSGSNATFNNCQFGNSYSDGLVPYCNVQVNNCFFKDMASVATEGAVHTDGTQLYGIDGTDVHNIAYNNCRFEIPPLKAPESNAYINACIMFQLEFSSAHDVAFNDCIVNGGGFSIYATSKDSEKYTIADVTFDGIRFGCANKYGIFYTKINKAVQVTDVAEVDALYVGSVWKENGNTHFSVTNDTNRERTLLIYTDKGQYTYTIPACPKGSELTESMTYGDLPFDVDIVVPEECNYAVCFDSTISGCGEQIRFVNWSGSQVYLPADITDTLYGDREEVLVSGTCGKNVTFTLTKAGVLTLSGTGDTYSYNSQKFPDWVDYKDYIKEVRVGEGIEGLGSMIFRHCTSIQKVTLPSTLKTIGQYAFGGCVSISEFTIPAGVTTLGKSVFSGTPLSEIHYAGDDWSAVTIGTGNENLVERLVVDKDTVKEPESAEQQSTDVESTEPKSTEPKSTEPKSTEPEITEPKSTEPEITEPKSTEPESTEAEITEPESTEPQSTESEITEPESAELESAEAQSTEPEGTTSEETESESDDGEDKVTGGLGGSIWIFVGLGVALLAGAGILFLRKKKLHK